MSILDRPRDSKHLFLEKQKNDGNSFVANVNIVAKNIDEVITVAHNIEYVITVANSIEHVITVSDNISHVIAVSTNIDHVVAVSENIADVVTCSRNITYIAATGQHITEVIDVARNISSVVNVSNNMYDVNLVASWNMPVLAAQIHDDRLDVDEKTATTIEYANRAETVVTNAENTFDKCIESIAKTEQLEQDYLGLVISVGRDIVTMSDTILAQSIRITQHIMKCEKDFEQYKEDNTEYCNNLIEEKTTEKVESFREEFDDKVEALEVNVTKNVASLADTVLAQSIRITEHTLDCDAKVASINDRVNELDEEIDTRFEEKEISLTNDIAKLVDTNISQGTRITEIAKDFREHQLNDTERFSNLSYASVVHTRMLQELNEFKIAESVSDCLATCREVLTNLMQSERIFKLYLQIKAGITGGTSMDGSNTITDFGVIGTTIVDDDETDSTFVDMGIIPENP